MRGLTPTKKNETTVNTAHASWEQLRLATLPLLILVACQYVIMIKADILSANLPVPSTPPLGALGSYYV